MEHSLPLVFVRRFKAWITPQKSSAVAFASVFFVICSFAVSQMALGNSLPVNAPVNVGNAISQRGFLEKYQVLIVAALALGVFVSQQVFLKWWNRKQTLAKLIQLVTLMIKDVRDQIKENRASLTYKESDFTWVTKLGVEAGLSANELFSINKYLSLILQLLADYCGERGIEIKELESRADSLSAEWKLVSAGLRNPQ